MEIRTFGELIDWTRSLHGHLARCLASCATKNEEERAKALDTRVYDYLSHNPVKSHRTCDKPYAKLDFEGICREVFDFHDQIIDLYKTLIGKAEIPEAKELLESLLTMEQNESMRLARQIGRMEDL